MGMGYSSNCSRVIVGRDFRIGSIKPIVTPFALGGFGPDAIAMRID